MLPPSFPQEMIDKIIDEFSDTTTGCNLEDRTPNKRVLASLSMVARAWRGRSQKHLFCVLDLQKPPSTDLTEADLAYLGPVFSFTRELEINGRWEVFSRFDLVTAAFLRCFRNLETLSLTEWDSWRFTAEQLSTCFSHFGETVIDLKLEGAASSESLIVITSMFPRLLALQIYTTRGGGEEARGIISEEELPTTGCFEGYLYLWGLSKHHHYFLDFLASTTLGLETIRIDNCEPGDEMGWLIDSSTASLESLVLHIDDPWVGSTSLSECTQLRDVSVSHPWSESTASLLRTIRSPHLKEFVIYSWLGSDGELFRAEDADLWTRTDGELCEAYDQWAKHATRKIAVMIEPEEKLRSGYLLEEHLKTFLPRSTEKLALTVRR